METDIKKPYLFIFNECSTKKKVEYQLTPLKSIFICEISTQNITFVMNLFLLFGCQMHVCCFFILELIIMKLSVRLLSYYYSYSLFSSIVNKLKFEKLRRQLQENVDSIFVLFVSFSDDANCFLFLHLASLSDGKRGEAKRKS